MEGLGLGEVKEPSPLSFHHMGCYEGEGWLIKPAKLMTLLPPGPHIEARNEHIKATLKRPWGQHPAPS